MRRVCGKRGEEKKARKGRSFFLVGRPPPIQGVAVQPVVRNQTAWVPESV